MSTIDLHVHSNCSDGTYSPAEIVSLAAKASLSAMALTDHDTVRGITEAKKAAALLSPAQPLEVVSGIEISAAWNGRDIHILGYFVDETNKVLQDYVDRMETERNLRNEKMAKKLRAAGADISMEKLHAAFPNALLTRAHFAKYLSLTGFVPSADAAYSQYIGHSCPCFVTREYVHPQDVISAILSAGGVPVLAHPLLYGLDTEGLHLLFSTLVSYGLRGLEVMHSSNEGFDETLLFSYAKQYSLLPTGGSDFHGAIKPSVKIGVGHGNLQIPESMLTALREAVRN